MLWIDWNHVAYRNELPRLPEVSLALHNPIHCPRGHQLETKLLVLWLMTLCLTATSCNIDVVTNIDANTFACQSVNNCPDADIEAPDAGSIMDAASRDVGTSTRADADTVVPQDASALDIGPLDAGFAVDAGESLDAGSIMDAASRDAA